MRAPPPARDNSCALSWFAMLSEVAIRALPRRAVLRWVMRLLCALVAIGAGAAVEAAAGARDDGVIGAPLCAQTGAAIARAAAIATPFKRCFMPLSSVAVPGRYAEKGSLSRRVTRVGLEAGDKDAVVPFPRIRNLRDRISDLARAE